MSTYDHDDDFEVNTPEGSGGGSKSGCFPRGTLVNTPRGYRPIEQLSVGDEVYGFDARTGGVSVVEVTSTPIHSWEDVHDVSPLIVLVHERGEICLTANHWVYRANSRVGEYANFDEAKDFKVGDALVTEYGEEVVITEVKDGPVYDFVYNLEVENVHTYIASGIRVHNGGGGGKSDGGGSQHVHFEAPNDLRSRAVARVLEVISEGEIVGLADAGSPAKSIYFDTTPVQNSDGTFNFTAVSVDQRVGLPSQGYMGGFPLVEAEIVVSVEARAGLPITRTVSAANVDGARVTVLLANGLYRQDVTNGDMFGSSVSFHIDTRPQGGTWTTVISDTISGKAMTAYERAYRINRASSGIWEMRVVRDTPNSTSSAVVDKLVFSRYTEIQDLKLPYNDTAYVGVTVDSESTGGRIPRRAYDVYGIKVKVPSNYKPTTRAYSGVWNGTFQTAWSDNPAWVLYDLLTNARYGLGEYIKDYNVDKFSFYNAAVYNDTLVNTGAGTGTFEPRYTFHAQIMGQEDSWKLLQSVASTMRAALYIGGGVVKLIQDRPGTAVKLVSRANVVDGMLDYSSSAARARHTACNVVYNDPTDGYLPKIITVEDSAGIARYGYNLVEQAAFACVSEGQARRVGRWTLDTELNSTELLTYRAGLNQADVDPGDIIKVMDADYASLEQAGKVISSTTTSITIDRPVNITGGGWTVDLVSSDGSTIVTRTLSNSTGNGQTVLKWGSPLPAPTKPWSDWVITGAVVPRLFRVLTVREVEKGVVEISALLYDPNKYARVEAGVYIPSPAYFVPPSNIPLAAVTGITWKKESVTDPSGIVKRFLRVSWTQNPASYVSGYTYRWSRNNGIWTNGGAQQPYVLIPADFSGTYTIAVYAYNAYGTQSPAAVGTYILDLTDTPATSALAAVTKLKVSGNTPSSNTFVQQDLVVEWTNPNVNNPSVGMVLQDYEVTVRDKDSSGIVLRTEYVTGETYNYSFTKNKEDSGGVPKRSVIIRVRCRDTFQQMSVHTQDTFTNNTPPAPTLTLQAGVDMVFATMNTSAELDIKGYYVFASKVSGYTPTLADVVYKGDSPFSSMPAEGGETYYFRAAAFDTFSDDISELLITPQVSVTPSAPITQFNDYSFTGLVFKPNAPAVNQVSWTACTAIKTAGASGVGTTWAVVAGSSAAWTAGTMYVYYREGDKLLRSTTVLNEAVAANQLILATYKGGTNVTVGDGKAFIDGNSILAGTIGASQLVAGTAVITGEAQMAAATINAAAIKDGVLTNAKIANATIETLKLKHGSVVSFLTFNNGGQSSTNISDNAPYPGKFFVRQSLTTGTQLVTPKPTGIPGPFSGVLQLYLTVTRNSNIPITVHINMTLNFYNASGAYLSSDTKQVTTSMAGAYSSQVPIFWVLSKYPGEITELGPVDVSFYSPGSSAVYMTMTISNPSGYQLLNLR